MSKRRLMVVGAHGADPFDLAGGTMAKYASRGHEVMVVALSLGASDFVHKPIKRRFFLAALDHQVAQMEKGSH